MKSIYSGPQFQVSSRVLEGNVIVVSHGAHNLMAKRNHLQYPLPLSCYSDEDGPVFHLLLNDEEWGWQRAGSEFVVVVGAASGDYNIKVNMMCGGETVAIGSNVMHIPSSSDNQYPFIIEPVKTSLEMHSLRSPHDDIARLHSEYLKSHSNQQQERRASVIDSFSGVDDNQDITDEDITPRILFNLPKNGSNIGCISAAAHALQGGILPENASPNDCTVEVQIEVENLDMNDGYLVVYLNMDQPLFVGQTDVWEEVVFISPMLVSQLQYMRFDAFIFDWFGNVMTFERMWVLLSAAPDSISASYPLISPQLPPRSATFPPASMPLCRLSWPLNPKINVFASTQSSIPTHRPEIVVLVQHSTSANNVEWIADRCSSTCVVVKDTECNEDADIVIWQCGAHPPPHIRKPRNQIWVNFCIESENYRGIWNHDPNFIKMFDVVANYHPQSQVPVYAMPPDISLLLLPPPEARNELVMYLSSNCWEKPRDAYVASLMQHMNVHSYGQCLHNTDIDDDSPPWFNSTAMGLMRKYKFVLTFENSYSEDYISERVYLALIAGSVPVYLGARNIASFLPSADCFVNVRDFKDPKALADYLKFVHLNDVEYARFHRWRQMGIPEHLVEMSRNASRSMQRPYTEGNHNSMLFNVDRFCQLAHTLQR